MQRHIAILVADGFTDSGLSVAVDVFRTSNALAARSGKEPPFRIGVVSASGRRVRAASGLTLQGTRSLAEAAHADIVLIPGLWVEDAAGVDATLERKDVRLLIGALGAAYARGAMVGSSCGAAFLLAEAGILDGRSGTTSWWLAPHLKRRRPQIDVDATRSLVVDGRVLTAGAVFAQADLALHIVARFAGPSVARWCARLLLLDTHASQAPYMAITYLGTEDRSIRKAERWVRAHLAEDFDIAMLARHAGVSPRTLARRLEAALGVGPLEFVQRLRVEVAVQLLETTRSSLQEISLQVGYSDQNALRRLIRRETNSSPRELRRKQLGIGVSARG